MCARPRRVQTRRESFDRWESGGSEILTVKVRVKSVRTGTQVYLTPNVSSSAKKLGIEKVRDGGSGLNGGVMQMRPKGPVMCGLRGQKKTITWIKTCEFPESCLRASKRC